MLVPNGDTVFVVGDRLSILGRTGDLEDLRTGGSSWDAGSATRRALAVLAREMSLPVVWLDCQRLGVLPMDLVGAGAEVPPMR